MCTHLRVLSKSYSENTNMTGFRWFSKNLCVLELWTRVASALEGLRKELESKIFSNEYIMEDQCTCTEIIQNWLMGFILNVYDVLNQSHITQQNYTHLITISCLTRQHLLPASIKKNFDNNSGIR